MIFKYSKNIMMATLLMATATMVSCKNGETDDENNTTKISATSTVKSESSAQVSLDGFEKTANGLYYKFEKQNPQGQQVKMGDVLYGELTIKLDTLTIRSNTGQPDYFAQAVPNWEPRIYEGLLMMHAGDVATFSYEADTLVKMLNGQAIHPSYKAGTGQKIVYTINLLRAVPMEEFQQQQEAEMKKMKTEEPGKIRDYVKQNNIKVKPNADGLYTIVTEKGSGEKVTAGKQVTVQYTGRLLDGTKFDSSVDRGEPFSFRIGQGQVIQGWDKGLLGQTVGSKLQLIIPSSIGYGERGSGPIPPYSTLVFDIEILSVN